jgi:hypothetical protein
MLEGFAAFLPVLRMKYKLQQRELAPQELPGAVAVAQQRAHAASARNYVLEAEYEGQEVFVLITARPKAR